MIIKVCHITSVHPQRDIRIFHKECVFLSQAGYEVSLIAPGDFSGLDSGVNIFPFPKYSNRFLRILFAPFKMYYYAVKQGATMYHFHDPELIFCGFFLRLSGKKVIFDIHENVALSFLQKEWIPKPFRYILAFFYRGIEKILLKSFSLLILAELSYKKYYPSNSVIIQNFPLYLQPAAEMKVLIPPVKFVYVGVIHHSRGIWKMLDIIQLLNQRGCNVELHLAGPIRPSQLENEMREYLVAHSLTEKVKYHGVLPVSESYQLVEECHVGFALWDALPNFYECIPTKMYEYMLKGLPVIVPDYPVFSEFIVHKQCAISVPYHDTERASFIIEELIMDKIKFELLSVNGKNAVKDIYNWESQSEILIGEYDRLSGRKV